MFQLLSRLRPGTKYIWRSLTSCDFCNRKKSINNIKGGFFNPTRMSLFICFKRVSMFIGGRRMKKWKLQKISKQSRERGSKLFNQTSDSSANKTTTFIYLGQKKRSSNLFNCTSLLFGWLLINCISLKLYCLSFSSCS
jgi:hypothetical protein